MDDNQWLNDFLEDSIPKWKADPVMFMREVLLFEPDDWQIEVARGYRSSLAKVSERQVLRRHCFCGSWYVIHIQE